MQVWFASLLVPSSAVSCFAFINIEVLSVKKVENLYILRNPSNIGIKSVHWAKVPNSEKLPDNWYKWQPCINLYVFCCKDGIVQFHSNLLRASLNSKVYSVPPARVFTAGSDRCIHWCGQHGLNITFPPEISRKFYFRVWTFLKLLTDLPRFLSTSLCLYESVTNWMVHHDTTERLRHPLPNLDVLEEGWELPVALGQVFLLLLLHKHIHARVTSEKSWQTHWWRETY